VSRLPPRRVRPGAWRLFLNLSWTACASGLLLALIGAWLAAAITFTVGLVSALMAGWRHRRASSKTPPPNAKVPHTKGRR
jgi:membrane protein implicated in regulation of membrane protease activity